MTATHTFLSPTEIKNIKPYALKALKTVPHLIIIENVDNSPVAFMEIANNKLEMLFVKSDELRKGYGKELLLFGVTKYNILEVVINEQNNNAKEFYQHMGFEVYKRSEFDEQNQHFPILYMRRNK